MKTIKIIGAVICTILALAAIFATLHKPSMVAGIFIWGAGAYFLFNSANKE